MDPLSDILSLLKPRRHMSAGFEASGPWAVQFPDQQNSIKCGAVVYGRCFLQVEGVEEAVCLEAGDCFLLPWGRPFLLASDLALPPIEARQIFPAAREGGVVSYNGAEDFFLVSSRFALTGHHVDTLLRMLPAIVVIRDDREPSVLRWAVELMMRELREPQPGGFLVTQHLAHIILVQALRVHLVERMQGGVGWLFALADRQMGAAISAIHGDPAFGWTVQGLAEHVGMSRSTFAQKFKEKVGMAPMEYLTRWRMMVAGSRLAEEPVSVIALSLGYESESAFSTAFKRVMKCTPRQYGRRGEVATRRSVPADIDGEGEGRNAA
jgi:AraC-like DNA-binding protein